MNILYSQCWEDSRLLGEALAIRPGADVLSIASAGDNALALLLADPGSVTAIDYNPTQLHLLELKMRAIEWLDHQTMVEFVGARPSNRRLHVYASLREHLTESSRAFWDQHAADIRSGIIHCGRLERYLRLFRRYVLPLIHRQGVVEQLLRAASPHEQETFYHGTWDRVRWRVLFKIFFGRAVMSRLGREASFFRYVDRPDVATVLLQRARFGLTQVAVGDNFFLEYILTGRYRDLRHAPSYLNPAHFDTLKKRLGRLQLVCSRLDRFLQQAAPDSFSQFNLSDVFEYMSEAQRAETWRQITRVARPVAVAAYWSLFVPVGVPSPYVTSVHPVWLTRSSGRLRDRGFFYGDFQARPVGAMS